MGLLDRFWPWRRKDTSSTTTNPAGWFVDWIRGGEATLSGISVTPESALRLAAVWACVRVRSEDIGKIPCLLYRRLPEGGKERATDHTLYNLINVAPNARMTAFEFRQTMQAELDLRGNALAVKEYDLRGRISALWPVPWKWVQVLATPDWKDLFYRINWPYGQMETLPGEAVVHLRGVSLDGVVGISPIAHHRETIGLAIAAEKYGAAFFGNNAQPRGAVKVPGIIDPATAKALREDWERKYRGLENAHRIAIFDGGMEYVQTGMDNVDAQYLESRKLQNQEIWRIYRIPAHKVGDLERSTYCLPANAKIFTENGPKCIADIRPGECVWSRSSAGAWVTSRVERSSPTGIDHILRIKTTNRTLRLNAKHRVLARRPHDVPPLHRGGRNVLGRKMWVQWRTEYVPAGNLRPGDTIVTLDRLPDVGGETAPNGRIVTKGFMAFCGLLLGDGNVFAGAVTIARATTATYIAYYREIMTAEFVKTRRFAWAHGQKIPVLLREYERCTTFSSVGAARELKELGFSGTARTKRIPGWIYSLSEELRLAFLAGFLDADGSVDKKGRMAFHSVSADLLDDVRHLCMGLGIPVTNARRALITTKLPNGEIFTGPISTFTCSDPGANRRVPTATPTYAERLNAGQPFGRKGRAYPHFGGVDFEEDGCGLSRIVEISREPAEVVFDLSVRGTHNFIADGVVVHNSNIEMQSLEYVTDCLMTEFRRWEQTLGRDLLTEAEQQTMFFEFLPDSLLRGDIKSRYDAYAIARNWGFLSVNEIRERENLNRVKNGDVYLQPMNMQEAGAPPVPAAAPAPAKQPPAADNLPPASAKALLQLAQELVAREETVLPSPLAHNGNGSL